MHVELVGELMSFESILSIDNKGPESLDADYLIEADMHLMKDLVAFRKERNIDQATVAHRMGIDPSGVSKIEAGHRDLLQSTLQRYAMAVGAVIDHQVRAFDDISDNTKPGQIVN